MIAPSDKPRSERSSDGEREAIPMDLAQSPLWDELGQHLTDHGLTDLDALREQLRHVPWCHDPAGEALQRALERADPEALVALAHRLGREWLAAS